MWTEWVAAGAVVLFVIVRLVMHRFERPTRRPAATDRRCIEEPDGTERV